MIQYAPILFIKEKYGSLWTVVKAFIERLWVQISALTSFNKTHNPYLLCCMCCNTASKVACDWDSVKLIIVSGMKE